MPGNRPRPAPPRGRPGRISWPVRCASPRRLHECGDADDAGRDRGERRAAPRHAAQAIGRNGRLEHLRRAHRLARGDAGRIRTTHHRGTVADVHRGLRLRLCRCPPLNEVGHRFETIASKHQVGNDCACDPGTTGPGRVRHAPNRSS